jgi:hypothetical protein
VQRILDTERAWIDGLRLLAYRTGLELDVARQHPDAQRRDRAQQWCSLVTPVLKALCTEQGFHGASRCLQVFGGHGYVREWGIEQVVRDARITMIYEGTNEIQAIDLLLRKVLPDGGAALAAMFDGLAAEFDPQDDADVLARFAALHQLARELAERSLQHATLPYEAADDFLRAVGLALFGWAWRSIERVPAAQDARWRDAAAAAHLRILPEFELRLQILRTQCAAAQAQEAAAAD